MRCSLAPTSGLSYFYAPAKEKPSQSSANRPAGVRHLLLVVIGVLPTNSVQGLRFVPVSTMRPDHATATAAQAVRSAQTTAHRKPRLRDRQNACRAKPSENSWRVSKWGRARILVTPISLLCLPLSVSDYQFEICEDARSPSESVAHLRGRTASSLSLRSAWDIAPRWPNSNARQTVKKKENLSNFIRSAKLVLPFDRTRNRDPSSRFVPRPCFLCMVHW
jgi:hypothetical protein